MNTTTKTTTPEEIAAALPGDWSVQTDTHSREYLRRGDGLCLWYATGNGRKGQGSLRFDPPADPAGSAYLDWPAEIDYNRREQAKAATRCSFTATRSAGAIAGHWTRSCLEATEEAYRAALARIDRLNAGAAKQQAAAETLAEAGYEIRSAQYNGGRGIRYGVDTITAWADPDDPAPSWTIETHGSICLYRDLYATPEQAIAVAKAMRNA